ncbi:hypothetical protein ACLX1H_000817 [Fusarium chlamydosporum]
MASFPTPSVNWTSSRENFEKGFESIFVGQPQTTRSDLENLFTRNYTSLIDGKPLGLEEFIQHIHHLRENTANVNVNVTHFLREGNQLAERHFVTVEFSNKPTSKYEVFLFATVHKSGRIENLVETLRHLEGLEEDGNLGSATA